VRAVQINFADQDATFTGKVPGLCQQYLLEASSDGTTWKTVIDKSENKADVPHDYVEFAKPIEARFVRIVNKHVPSGKFALSGLRVFGTGHGDRSHEVGDFVVLRGENERRNAWLKWRSVDDATGYLIRFGTEPGRLYSAVMVYGANDVWLRSLDRDRSYYFQIEAFNENGCSEPSPAAKAE
jgi:hypothetical protein